MALDVINIFDQIVTFVDYTGQFDSVNTHQPLSAPPNNGLIAGIWIQELSSNPLTSGLNKTSARIEFNIRIYNTLDPSWPDTVDYEMLTALDSLMTSFHGGFTLSGYVMEVDLLGAYGKALRSVTGYQDIGGVMYRVITITLPLIIDNLWPQVP